MRLDDDSEVMIAVLRCIRDDGSIFAYTRTGHAYSTAWGHLKDWEAACGAALYDVKGSNAHGSRLTLMGELVLEHLEDAERELLERDARLVAKIGEARRAGGSGGRKGVMRR